MPVRIEEGEGAVTAYLEGEIDHHSAREIREAIEKGCYNRTIESGRGSPCTMF